MTRQQEAMVKRIKWFIEENDLFHKSENYEFKQYEVIEAEGGYVTLYSETGLKCDEGTMAALICRTRRQVFIGKRGGLKSYGWNKKLKKSTQLVGWTKAIIFGARQ